MGVLLILYVHLQPNCKKQNYGYIKIQRYERDPFAQGYKSGFACWEGF